MPNDSLLYDIATTSLGTLLVATSTRGVAAVLIGDSRDELLKDLRERFPASAIEEGSNTVTPGIAAMIDDPRRAMPFGLDLRGTEFQLQVWKELMRIPAGETVSYTELAERLGRPEAVRAVASACGANPCAVLVPCHRVLRSDGSMHGYRWGLDRKRRLLEMEGALPQAGLFS